MVSNYFYLFSLLDGGHLGISYKNEIQASNNYMIWNHGYRIHQKNVFLQGFWCPGSKLNFFKMGLAAFFDFGFWKKLPEFLGGTWKLNFL